VQECRTLRGAQDILSSLSYSTSFCNQGCVCGNQECMNSSSVQEVS
jgi:hypothetical protein